MSTLNSRLQLSILNRKKTKNALQKGFTLIELLITVVILGVLSSVAVPGFIAQKNKADIQSANAQGRALMAACRTFMGDETAIPASINSGESFGNVTFTPTVTIDQDSGALTECSSLTLGTSTPQAFALDMTTGDMSSDTAAR